MTRCWSGCDIRTYRSVRDRFEVVAKELCVSTALERFMNWITVCQKHADLKFMMDDHDYRVWIKEHDAWERGLSGRRRNRLAIAVLTRASLVSWRWLK